VGCVLLRLFVRMEGGTEAKTPDFEPPQVRIDHPIISPYFLISLLLFLVFVMSPSPLGVCQSCSQSCAPRECSINKRCQGQSVSLKNTKLFLIDLTGCLCSSCWCLHFLSHTLVSSSLLLPSPLRRTKTSPSHSANDFCKENKRQTIYTSDIISALKSVVVIVVLSFLIFFFSLQRT
jgi:hypothetical protein